MLPYLGAWGAQAEIFSAATLSLAEGDAILLESTGTVEGLIAREPRGANGFGYDPVFLIPARRLTIAEMPQGEKNALSHRGQAVRRFAQLLADLLQSGRR